MTNPVSCNKAITALRGLLDGACEPESDLVAHWKDCPDCSRTLRHLLHELEGLEAPLSVAAASGEAQATLQRGTEEVRRQQRIRLVLSSSLVLLVPLFCVALGFSGVLSHDWAAALVAGTAAVSLVVLVLMVGRLPRRWGFYRRLGPGRQLGGVCLGMAERTHTPVLFWRLVFLAFLLWGGYGVIIYLLLLISMPVHPDDRQYLLKFRLAHWWRGL